MTQTPSSSTAIVTGAASGLGLSVARRIAERGLAVTLADRDADELAAARDRILRAVPDATLDTLVFDLASLNAIKDASARYLVEHEAWHFLFNLAEVRGIPQRTLTEDGFEWNFGVNHLGHFTLTGLLLTGAAKQCRVVSLTSAAYRSARTRFHDLRFDHGYKASRAFAQSKRAQLLFARELDRRARDPRARDYPRGISSIAVQPELHLFGGVSLPRTKRLAPPLDVVAETVITAALDEHVQSGALVAPTLGNRSEHSAQLVDALHLDDESTEARRLWRISDQLTRVSW